MARSGYKIYSDFFPHFLTFTTVNWLPVFTNPIYAEEIFSALRYLQKHRDLKIFAYVLMEHHLHLVASADGLSKVLQSFTSYSARQIIDHMIEQNNQFWLNQLHYFKKRWKTDQIYQLWQEGSHPQQIQDENMMLNKIEYIHNNPVERGYIEKPEHWLYSSARNYAGLEAKLEIAEW